MSEFQASATITGIRASEELLEAVVERVEQAGDMIAPAFSADYAAGEMSMTACVYAATEDEAQGRAVLALLNAISSAGAVDEWPTVSIGGETAVA